MRAAYAAANLDRIAAWFAEARERVAPLEAARARAAHAHQLANMERRAEARAVDELAAQLERAS